MASRLFVLVAVLDSVRKNGLLRWPNKIPDVPVIVTGVELDEVCMLAIGVCW